MKKKPSFPTTPANPKSAVEFLTVFGFSILLTLAGLHGLEMLPAQQKVAAQEIYFAAANELPAPRPVPTLSVEKLRQLLDSFMP